jgi:hypothetical protein
MAKIEFVFPKDREIVPADLRVIEETVGVKRMLELARDARNDGATMSHAATLYIWGALGRQVQQIKAESAAILQSLSDPSVKQCAQCLRWFNGTAEEKLCERCR